MNTSIQHRPSILRTPSISYDGECQHNSSVRRKREETNTTTRSKVNQQYREKKAERKSITTLVYPAVHVHFMGATCRKCTSIYLHVLPVVEDKALHSKDTRNIFFPSQPHAKVRSTPQRKKMNITDIFPNDPAFSSNALVSTALNVSSPTSETGTTTSQWHIHERVFAKTPNQCLQQLMTCNNHNPTPPLPSSSYIARSTNQQPRSRTTYLVNLPSLSGARGGASNITYTSLPTPTPRQ